MYGMDFQREMVKEKMGQAHREAEERQLAKLVGGSAPLFRARVARRLFEAAVMLERDATWNAVWEKMEAPEAFVRSSG